MLLTLKEKKFLIKMLAKQKRSLFNSKEDQRLAADLLEKFEQSMRNEKVNDMKKSRL